MKEQGSDRLMKPPALEVDQALSLVLGRAEPLPPIAVQIPDALGLVLAEDVVSRVDSPPFDKALMDGYAVVAADLAEGTAELQVLAKLTAGDVPRQRVVPGTAMRIMTGAPLPDGADAVVVLEDTECIATGQRPTVRVSHGPVSVGRHMLRRGTLLRQGETVLRSGRRLSAVDLGLLAETATSEVRAHPRPRVAVLATGSELVAPGETAGPGQIPNSNGPMLCGLVAQAGGQPCDLGIGRDDPAELRRLMTRGLESDVLVLSGGVSTGDHDYVPRVLAELGVAQVLHGVRLKPGKPFWFGVASHGGRRKLVFGLPGNPVSCLVCFELFVRPALGRLAGVWNSQLRRRGLRLAEPFEHRGDRPTYYPARLRQEPDGDRVEPLAWQGSADLRTIAEADALVLFPAGTRRYTPDELLTVLMLGRP